MITFNTIIIVRREQACYVKVTKDKTELSYKNMT